MKHKLKADSRYPEYESKILWQNLIKGDSMACIPNSRTGLSYQTHWYLKSIEYDLKRVAKTITMNYMNRE
ncbi:MAG: hypothetical protein AAF363_20705 [Bacteroidota bacterium]